MTAAAFAVLCLSSLGICLAASDDSSADGVTVIDSGTNLGSKGTVYWEYRSHDGAYELALHGTGYIPDYINPASTPWHAYRSSITMVTVFGDLTWVGDYAFSEFSKVTSIRITAPVTGFGTGVFDGCSSLMFLEMPNVYPGESLFDSCHSIENIGISSSPSGGHPDSLMSSNLTSKVSGKTLWSSVWDVYIITSDVVDLSAFIAPAPGKILDLNSQATGTKGGPLYDSDGVTPLEGDARAGHSYHSTGSGSSFKLVAFGQHPAPPGGFDLKYVYVAILIFVLLILCFAVRSVMEGRK